MDSTPNVVGIAARAARSGPGELSDLAIVPRYGRGRHQRARTPGPVKPPVRGEDPSLQFDAGRIVQFKSPGIGSSHGDPADARTGPTLGTAA
jgi:hypothetical protein